MKGRVAWEIAGTASCFTNESMFSTVNLKKGVLDLCCCIPLKQSGGTGTCQKQNLVHISVQAPCITDLQLNFRPAVRGNKVTTNVVSRTWICFFFHPSEFPFGARLRPPVRLVMTVSLLCAGERLKAQTKPAIRRRQG